MINNMRKKPFKISILDDDKYFNLVLTAYVKTVCNPFVYRNYEFEIESYHTAKEFLENVDTKTEVLFLDNYLLNEEDDENINGPEVLEEVIKRCKDCKVIMISAHGTITEAVKLIKNGVYDYIDKTANTNNRVGMILHKIMKEDQVHEGFI